MPPDVKPFVPFVRSDRERAGLTFDASLGSGETNLLELRPRRSADWREKGARVVIERPRPAGSGPRWLWRWLGYHLGVKSLRLDERGSFVWRRLDGATTVAEVARELRERFGAAVEPAEERLGVLLRSLHRGGLVAYPEWETAAESARIDGARSS